jgi:hypothetical protein
VEQRKSCSGNEANEENTVHLDRPCSVDDHYRMLHRMRLLFSTPKVLAVAHQKRRIYSRWFAIIRPHTTRRFEDLGPY